MHDPKLRGEVVKHSPEQFPGAAALSSPPAPLLRAQHCPPASSGSWETFPLLP